MLRHALRRLFWLVPVLIGVTLTSFVLVSYVPASSDETEPLSAIDQEQAVERERSRFSDLPRFFNERPVDVAARVDEALAHVQADTPEAKRSIATLVRLGGAALPNLLPRLDSLDSSARTRVALGLAPVAERMGIRADAAKDPAQTVAFWNRYWADRSIDFRPANARRAVKRLLEHGTVTREADVVELDTYALESLIAALEEVAPQLRSAPSSDAVDSARRLAGAAAHMTAREDEIAREAGPADALACIARWQAWWLVHASDYTSYTGASRFVAMLTDTQYAKWAERALFGGESADEASVLAALRKRAPTTLYIVLSAIVLAYSVSVAASIAGSLARRRRADAWIATAWIVAYAVPTACLAALWPAPERARMLAAIVTLACGLAASPLAQHRVAMKKLLAQDHIRFAAAYGVSRLRIAAGHALRGSLLPIVALFSVDLPAAIGGAFVVETAFGIRGLGEETLRAVRAHDVAWLVGLAFITALVLTLGTIASDIALSALDPRLSPAAIRRRRGAS